MLVARRPRPSGERGFAMAVVMGVMLSAIIFGLAAFAAAQGGILQSADSRDRKQAYAAAEAGLAWYQAKLSADPNFWTKCATDTSQPVNNLWDGTGTDPRRFRTLGGSTARFAIELIPAPGQTTCSQSTMIDEDGGLRLRSTGIFSGEKRSIVAKFTRKRFLDYVYFTDFETSDPDTYPPASRARASQYCGNSTSTPKTYRPQRIATRGTFACREIQFAENDVLLGPVHSNDSLNVCNASTFGEFATDVVESSQDPGWVPACNANTRPNFVGDYEAGVESQPMPTSNDGLEAQADLVLEGTNILVFNGNALTVQRITGPDGALAAGAATPTTWPANGLIYVKSDAAGGCTPQTPLEQDYDESGACANVYVSGNYSKDVTIASAKDVIVRGGFTATSGSDAMGGLIANNFVRVYHPVTAHEQIGTGNACRGVNTSTPLFGAGPANGAGVQIDAAILSLAHSFIVDSWNCGANLGTLTVRGAIAQKFRGPVGLVGGQGFLKNYRYDRRMRYRNPPLFLNPVGARWRIGRQNEQIPAR